MNLKPTCPTPEISDAKAWLKILAKYRTSHAGRSVLELAVTALPFAAFWTLTWLAVHYGFWWGLLLIVPAAGFLLRLFMIQHDCGHGSFFARRCFDDWTASHYDLPRPLRWLTGNIGIHHVHHLSSKVPYYRLPEVLQNHPELGKIGRIPL